MLNKQIWVSGSREYGVVKAFFFLKKKIDGNRKNKIMKANYFYKLTVYYRMINYSKNSLKVIK